MAGEIPAHQGGQLPAPGTLLDEIKTKEKKRARTKRQRRSPMKNVEGLKRTLCGEREIVMTRGLNVAPLGLRRLHEAVCGQAVATRAVWLVDPALQD
jgi:hypothetical protein